MIDEDVIAQFQRDYPDEAEALFQEGVQNERDRITALLKLSHPATSAIVAAAIANGQDASEIFHACFAARERSALPSQPASVAASQAPLASNRVSSRAPSTAAPQLPARKDSEQFAQTLKAKLQCARAHWFLRGRAKREALAAALTPPSAV